MRIRMRIFDSHAEAITLVPYLTCTFLERTTGFEPATLTLAR
jgi:hypothetical protein